MEQDLGILWMRVTVYDWDQCGLDQEVGEVTISIQDVMREFGGNIHLRIELPLPTKLNMEIIEGSDLAPLERDAKQLPALPSQ
ncbi:hypothetical protein T484DRAFT_1851079 [Baffinella frigidus]|nr:hypothetical protein T484DRAFT_1851079 [Cryptophyta sp. CCMP2293]